MIEPKIIYNDAGKIILAPTLGAARAFLAENDPDDYEFRYVGWMADVGWDAEGYETREEFEAGAPYDGWWSGVLPPASLAVTDDHMPGWEFWHVPTSTQDPQTGAPDQERAWEPCSDHCRDPLSDCQPGHCVDAANAARRALNQGPALTAESDTTAQGGNMAEPLGHERAVQIAAEVKSRYPGIRLEPYEVKAIAGAGFWSSGNRDADRLVHALAKTQDPETGAPDQELTP